jgi:hypothetical protein
MGHNQLWAEPGKKEGDKWGSQNLSFQGELAGMVGQATIRGQTVNGVIMMTFLKMEKKKSRLFRSPINMVVILK